MGPEAKRPGAAPPPSIPQGILQQRGHVSEKGSALRGAREVREKMRRTPAQVNSVIVPRATNTWHASSTVCHFTE
eukprot:9496783-Pyramimonas_sp.AAC.1